jgi:predicted nuclease with TOPRIM domain
MSENKEQIARIRKMERRLDRALAAVKRLTAALDKWEAIQDDITALDEYYSSDLWRKDFEDDEAGLLPADLKRGVLSEDGIWNLLTDCKELKDRLKKSGK